jgi:DMSO/TMAO reductase YedYZ heme-binding membrane subunit
VESTLKSWRLFWMLVVVITAANVLALSFADPGTARGTEWLIVHAIECALPFLVLAFTASSVAVLWKAPATRWLLANRRYVGLAFAYGMAWHFAYVARYKLVFGLQPKPFDLALDITGLLFLLAMTVTSFHPVRRRLIPGHWRRLHKSGIYVLWLLPTYFYLDDFHRDHSVFNFTVLAALLAALGVRGLAWARRPVSGRSLQPPPESQPSPPTGG